MAEVNWARLAGRMRGTLTLRSDPSYEEARRGLVWNALKPKRFPLAIAQVEDEGDVREAILFARANGLKIIVRGGGHNWNGAQVRDDYLVVDIRRFTKVTIHPELQKAIIQPIVTNEQNVANLGKYNLGFPVGDCPTVYASGYLLGGGLGLNTPHWGTGCQNVEAVHLIDAQGRSLVADAEHNPELFWSARGSAQGFPGVVVRYLLTPQPLPQHIRQAVFAYRLDEAQPFADWLGEIVLKQPSKLHSNTLITSTLAAKGSHDLVQSLPGPLRRLITGLFGDGDNEGGERKGWLTYVAAAFADTEAEADELLAPFKTPPPGPKPVVHFANMPSSFKFLNDFTGALFPFGRRYVVDYHWMGESLPFAGIVQRLTPEFKKTLDADSFVLIASYQTPPAEMMPPGAASFTMSSHQLVGVYGIGDQPKDVEPNLQWVANMRNLLAPDAVGLYVGECDLEAFPGRASQCYSPEAWARMREIKKKYDPDDLFAWFLGDESPSAK